MTGVVLPASGTPATLLLVAVALVTWPARRRGPATRPHGRLRAGARPGGRPGTGTPSMGPWWRVAGAAAGLCALAVATAAAGPSGLLAAAMLVATGAVLAGRMLAERRRHRALPDVLRGLRALTRELRAGAEPLTAVRGAADACRGAGAQVLGSLLLLMRTGEPGPDAVDQPTADPADRALHFLRSGWLLSRRHGVAFGRVVTAIADELTGQVTASQERSAQLAGPRMSGYVMAALPLAGLLLGGGMGVDPMSVLIGSPLGNLLLVVGVALLCGGLLWSARIVGE